LVADAVAWASRVAAQVSGEDARAAGCRSRSAAQTFAARSSCQPKKPAAKPVALTPLTPRERVVQLLDRFTFGPRPGEVDRVLRRARTWLNQQLNPGRSLMARSTPRLSDYPTLNMTPQQAMTVFPDRAQVNRWPMARRRIRRTPVLKAVYEVQVYKATQERDKKKADGTTAPPPELTDEQKAAQKKADQAEARASRCLLFALPKNQRMARLIAMPVEDRIAFTATAI
jgi:hypothetical protein